MSSAIARLRRAGDGSAHTGEIRALHDQGDTIARNGLAELFCENPPVGELVGWKDLHERLQATLAIARRAATRLDGISAQSS